MPSPVAANAAHLFPLTPETAYDKEAAGRTYIAPQLEG
jgi:hypothetical protein